MQKKKKSFCDFYFWKKSKKKKIEDRDFIFSDYHKFSLASCLFSGFFFSPFLRSLYRLEQ